MFWDHEPVTPHPRNIMWPKRGLRNHASDSTPYAHDPAHTQSSSSSGSPGCCPRLHRTFRCMIPKLQICTRTVLLSDKHLTSKCVIQTMTQFSFSSRNGQTRLLQLYLFLPSSGTWHVVQRGPVCWAYGQVGHM